MIYNTAAPTNKFQEGTPAYRFAVLSQLIASTDDAEVVAEFEEMAQSLGAEVAEHLETLLQVRNGLVNSAAAIDIELQRLQELKEIRLARAQRLHDAVVYYMDMIETTEVTTDLHTLRIKRNPPKVEIYDEMLIPTEYVKETVKVEYKPDKKAIADALKNGVPVDGCALVQTKRLEIK